MATLIPSMPRPLKTGNNLLSGKSMEYHLYALTVMRIALYRFLHYDCVVVPESSVTGQSDFPWEKITLLIEYEPLKQPLFDQDSHRDTQKGSEEIRTNDHVGKGSIVERLKLREYVTLKTAFKPTDKGESLT